MSFNSLPLSAPTRAALGAMNISEPTPIQAKCLPLLFAGRDVIGQARTGSGKTLAFALPMVEKVDPTVRAVQAMVLVPTRELAQQVGQVVDAAGKGRGVRTVLIFGGRSMGPQIGALKAGPQIVVGTPGRVLDLLRQGELQPGQIVYFVLDEADEMLDRGFAPDVERILAFMPATDRQTALFSATVPEWVDETAHKYLRNPEQVRVDTRPEDVPKIEHVILDVPEGAKLSVLRVLLDKRDDESVLVFGRTKHGVKKLAKQLVALGYPAAALQGNLSQNARDAVMGDFRARRVPILLATNVAARGLDVEHIGLVINYELPETTELLTHRVGRTGRMGREGDAITLLSPSDEPKWRQLSRTLKLRIPRKAWEGPLPSTPAAVNAIPLYEPRPPKNPAKTAAPRPAGQDGRRSGDESRRPTPTRSRAEMPPRAPRAPETSGPATPGRTAESTQSGPRPGWATGKERNNDNQANRFPADRGFNRDGAGQGRRQERRPDSRAPRPLRPASPAQQGGRSWKEDRELLEQEERAAGARR